MIPNQINNSYNIHWKNDVLICSLDVYVQLEGQWDIESDSYLHESNSYHTNLSMAKEYCSSRDNCFGVAVPLINVEPLSLSFPIRLTPKEDRYGALSIHKKEATSGNRI